MARFKAALDIKKKDLAYQNALFNGKISKIPTLEREARVLGRQQQIKEQLYLYLQKREETAISLAVTAPNAKVIDSALSSKSPVTPKRQSIYMSAMAIGLLLPLGVLYLLQMMDTKIKGRSDVESKLNIPILGDIPTSLSNEEIIDANSRTSAAEAVLGLYEPISSSMLNQVPDNVAKTVFVTSTVPKEGKTFVAVNLAGTIALSGKKVLLIGMDIRNPKLEDYLHLPKEGVTNYLSTKDLDIHSLIHRIPKYESFFVLPSGVIPPNPAELLMSNKVDVLFEQLKKEFDYIVVDTSPVHLVTDTLLIAQHPDAFVYVVRANYLDKSLLRVPYQLHMEKKLSNMAMLINDTMINKGYGYGYGAYGYGYGYGYGVEVTKKSWLQRLKDGFKKEA